MLNWVEYEKSFITSGPDVFFTDGKSMWTVPRKYYEFYVLEQKLTEFHGEKLKIFTFY